jgi:hypothetical protein
VINVLRLDQGLEVVLKDLGEVVLKLGTAEVLEDLLPVGRNVETTQVGLQLAREDLERRRLSDTVRSDETEHLSWSGSGETMKLEGVGGVTVSDLRFEVRRQVDNVDGFEGASVEEGVQSALLEGEETREEDALLRADTATNAKLLRDERNLLCRVNLDTKLACSENRGE